MTAFPYNPNSEVNDGAPWSEEDIRDLENHVRRRAPLEETAVLVPGTDRGSRGRESKRTKLTFRQG